MSQTNDENERTLFCGNIHDKVTEELLYELFLQVCVWGRYKIRNGTEQLN